MSVMVSLYQANQKQIGDALTEGQINSEVVPSFGESRYCWGAVQQMTHVSANYLFIFLHPMLLFILWYTRHVLLIPLFLLRHLTLTFPSATVERPLFHSHCRDEKKLHSNPHSPSRNLASGLQCVSCTHEPTYLVHILLHWFISIRL